MKPRDAERSRAMNAEKIVKELRWLSKNDEWVFAAETMAKAADLIESLQAQLAKEKRRADRAVEWIQEFTESIDQPCIACKYNTDSPVCNQICGGCGPMGSDSCKWEWRGDAEEDAE